jgi:hypothetical protein
MVLLLPDRDEPDLVACRVPRGNSLEGALVQQTSRLHRTVKTSRGKGTIDLIEEAVHLLRTGPTAALACYCVGTLPFVLGLLFFWGEMSRSAFAAQHLADASFAMAALFVWMKFWQSAFALRLRAHAGGLKPPVFSFSRCRRMLAAQALVQTMGMFALPLSAIFILPAASVYAFLENVTALGEGRADSSARDLCRKAARQASLWPGQNWSLLVFKAGFGLFVFLNWSLVCYSLPHLVKMLFGIESVFTRGGVSMLNTTFFAIMFGLTYLCVDPIMKSVYVLRCFYGESLSSGDDLKAELRRFAAPARTAALVAGLAIALLFNAPGRAAESAPAAASPTAAAPSSAGVSSAQLDGEIERVIQSRKYAWRLPREQAAPDAGEKPRGVIASFFEMLRDKLTDWAQNASEWLRDMLKKLFPARQPRSPQASSGYGWMFSEEIFLYGLVFIVLFALLLLGFRVLRNRGRKAEMVASRPVASAPDLNNDNVAADQLPEDGWLRLARELVERGEFRLALRAFYLASLVQLAGRNLLSIARFKSNLDYERELRRRAHSFPDLLSLFGENVAAFDRAWYGLHEVTADGVRQFAANIERIRSFG